MENATSRAHSSRRYNNAGDVIPSSGRTKTDSAGGRADRPSEPSTHSGGNEFGFGGKKRK